VWTEGRVLKMGKAESEKVVNFNKLSADINRLRREIESGKLSRARLKEKKQELLPLLEALAVYHQIRANELNEEIQEIGDDLEL
jgi:hypothetical protein